MTPRTPKSDLLGALRNRLQEGQRALREHFSVGKDVSSMLAGRSALIDSVLCELWNAQGFPDQLALVAVGGYGRGELYPASDVDLLILLPGDPDNDLQARLEEVVSRFWDIGLEIGHSVRTPGQCLAEAAADITVQTALIEARLLTGDKDLFRVFVETLRQSIDIKSFFKGKKLEQEERYLRFQDTPFSLEPNIKESPGGLRDLQIILWIAQAAGLGSSWQDLEAGGLVTAEECGHLQRCEASLRRLRIHLHYQLNRRDDRLLFDYQAKLAEQLGFCPTANRRASEMLMQDYYRNAKSVTQLNVILLQNMGAAIFPPDDLPPRVLNDRFQTTHDLLDVRHEQVFSEHPPAILESFLLLQRNADLKGMTARTLRALYRARTLIDDTFRAAPENHARFIEILQQPRGLIHELRRMNQYGILGRYLPNFGAIVGQMQHDLFHAYTVDQHTMMVIRNLRRFTMDEFAHEHPLCTRLISDFERNWLLYVAALFHDIAKGRGGDHSEQGTGDAHAFCIQHGLAENDTELVVWLVRRHLTMSGVAQKQDISDPEVVAAFATIVGDERHLTALYLLTVADIRGTSPKVWNSWKGQLLQELYNATLQRLREGAKATEPHGVIQERQDEAMRLLRYFALSATVHERLWKQLDTVYFLRHSAEEIAWHTRCLHYRPNDEKPVVKARLNPASEGLQVMVYTRDQRDLFVRLAGFFARSGYNIVDARIHTTRHGYALDSFVLLDTNGRDNDREMLNYIEHELSEQLRLQTPPQTPITSRLSRRLKHFPITPSVSIEADDKGSHFVLSLVAADRPGLLHAVATTLAAHGARLHTAKIATLGERAEDTFLISGDDLGQSAVRTRLEAELLEVLKV